MCQEFNGAFYSFASSESVLCSALKVLNSAPSLKGLWTLKTQLNIDVADLNASSGRLGIDLHCIYGYKFKSQDFETRYHGLKS